MPSSTQITDYMAYGTHAARPAAPNVPTGSTSIYNETDTGNTFAWSGAAWVQINGGAPAIVQSAAASVTTTLQSVTFGAAPTNGNLLVAFILTAGQPTPGTGWTNFFSQDASGTFWGNVYVKIAGAGESATQTPIAAAGTGSIVVFECSNAIPGPPKYANGAGVTNVNAANAFGTGEIILGLCCNEASNTLPTGFTGATADATAAGTTTSAAGFHRTAPTKGLAATSITTTYAGSVTTKSITLSIGLA